MLFKNKQRKFILSSNINRSQSILVCNSVKLYYKSNRFLKLPRKNKLKKIKFFEEYTIL